MNALPLYKLEAVRQIFMPDFGDISAEAYRAALMPLAKSRSITIAEAAKSADITPGAMKMRLRRKGVASIGKNSHGEVLYKIEDIMRMNA